MEMVNTMRDLLHLNPLYGEQFRTLLSLSEPRVVPLGFPLSCLPSATAMLSDVFCADLIHYALHNRFPTSIMFTDPTSMISSVRTPCSLVSLDRYECQA
jgi:hypothetical protein